MFGVLSFFLSVTNTITFCIKRNQFCSDVLAFENLVEFRWSVCSLFWRSNSVRQRISVHKALKNASKYEPRKDRRDDPSCLLLWQAYHSQLTSPQRIGNMALLPLKTSFKGPAPKMAAEGCIFLSWFQQNYRSCAGKFPILNGFSGDATDIIDEAVYYFKANVFFRNYEIKVWCSYVVDG